MVNYVELNENEKQYYNEINVMFQEIGRKIKTSTNPDMMIQYLSQQISILQNRYLPALKLLKGGASNELENLVNLMISDLRGALSVYQKSVSQQQQVQKQQLQLQQQLISDLANTSQGIARNYEIVRDKAWDNWDDYIKS
jgi:hypothetical protein